MIPGKGLVLIWAILFSHSLLFGDTTSPSEVDIEDLIEQARVCPEARFEECEAFSCTDLCAKSDTDPMECVLLCNLQASGTPLPSLAPSQQQARAVRAPGTPFQNQ
jgi:hypothetical protein